MLITDCVHLLDGLAGANAYLVGGDAPFLLDTGLPGQTGKILAYLDKVGIMPADLRGIVLTHYDVDHVGNARALQAIAGCPIYAHSLEIPYILHQKPRPGIKRYLPTLTRPMCGKLEVPAAISPLCDGARFQDWEVIHTPGHSPGHIVLYRNGVILVGDLLQGGRVHLAPSIFTWDVRMLKESVRDVIKRPLRWILPGHGPATPAAQNWLVGLEKSLR